MFDWERFFSIATTYSGLTAIGVSFYIYYSNPSRSVNCFTAAIVLGLGLWQLATSVAHSTIGEEWPIGMGVPPTGLPSLRFGVAALSICYLSSRLALDSIANPISPLLNRIFRVWPWTLFATSILTVPFTEAWMLSSHLPEALAKGPLYTPMRIALAVGCLCLIINAIKTLSNAQSTIRFELLNVIAAFALGPIVILLMTLASTHFPEIRPHIPSLFIIHFIWTAWLMTTRKIFSFSDLAITGVECLINFSAYLAVFLLVTFAVRSAWPESSFLSSGAIAIIIAYPISIISQRLLAQLSSRLTRRSNDQRTTRSEAIDTFSRAWTDADLASAFKQLVGRFLLAPDVNLESADSKERETWSLAKQRLYTHAKSEGWLTPQLANRSQSTDVAVSLSADFDSGPFSLVCVKSNSNHEIILFVGDRHGHRITTYAEARFILELMDLFLSGLERIRLAAKVTRAERLASVGFLASQFRHEGRNRLETIRAALELLNEGREADIADEHRRLLLTEIDDFIVSFNSSWDLPVTYASTHCISNIQALCVETCRSLEPIARRSGITITCEVSECWSKIDSRQFRQVILNLIKNSIDALHNILSANICISSKVDGTYILIDVKDNGPGVPDSIYPYLFQFFATSKESGTGLGLAISRSAIASMNGSITYMTPRGCPEAWFRIILLNWPQVSSQ